MTLGKSERVTTKVQKRDRACILILLNVLIIFCPLETATTVAFIEVSSCWSNGVSSPLLLLLVLSLVLVLVLVLLVSLELLELEAPHFQ